MELLVRQGPSQRRVAEGIQHGLDARKHHHELDAVWMQVLRCAGGGLSSGEGEGEGEERHGHGATRYGARKPRAPY